MISVVGNGLCAVPRLYGRERLQKYEPSTNTSQRNATQVYTLEQRKAHPTRSLGQDVLLVSHADGTMWASSPTFFGGGNAYFFSASSTATATETAAPPWVSSAQHCESNPATCRWQVATLPMVEREAAASYFFSASSTATATLTAAPPWVSNAQHCEWESRNLPVAGCHFAHGRKRRRSFLLLQCFLNSNSHGNGSADHGVVAHAQEAHHFYIKSALRRLCGDFSRTFGAVSPTFRKTRDTSIFSIGCAFLSETHLITSFVHETRSFD